jgi:uncharacterized protein (DUF1330 family)
MAAYCYFDILKVHDEPAMQEYREKVLTTVDQYGGRYVVVGGPFETKEGTSQPVFPVLIEFPTIEKADGWYNSEEYKSLKEKRLSAVESNAVFFQGI